MSRYVRQCARGALRGRCWQARVCGGVRVAYTINEHSSTNSNAGVGRTTKCVPTQNTHRQRRISTTVGVGVCAKQEHNRRERGSGTPFSVRV